MTPPRLLLILSVALLVCGLATPATAQKLAREAFPVPSEGFAFKPLDGLDAVPPGARDQVEVVKLIGEEFDIHGYAMAAPAAPAPEAGEGTGGDDGDGDEGRTRAGRRRDPIEPRLRWRWKGSFAAVEDTPSVDETHEIDGVPVRQRVWEWKQGHRGKEDVDHFVEVWSFELEHADIHLVYSAREEYSKRWAKAIERSAESFERIERVVVEEVRTDALSYADRLKFAEQEAARTPGWRAIGTPSERFVILTNATKDAFVDAVIKRLEISRDVFEKDFPPPADFDAVSVVRICKDREEFQRFSGAPAGVAGYFSPQTAELVLYDDVETNRNSTYAVVSHEAFHQYCHFLFGQSEAHRWFDEGTGDYYGGLEIVGARGRITPKMPAGLDRLSVIRRMLREGKYVPLEEHLNYDHGEWQRHGVPSYAQSWSIVYMLRQGMEGKVHRKVWEDGYEDIIPNYVATLNKGYRDLYESIREERRQKAAEEGRELSPEELVVNRFMVDPREKKRIWKNAMDASWGLIDLEQFEENWLLYVDKYLK